MSLPRQLQRPPQRHLALEGNLEQVVIGKAEQRAFQNLSQREIVLGLQHGASERQEVHGGKFVQEPHAVRA